MKVILQRPFNRHIKSHSIKSIVFYASMTGIKKYHVIKSCENNMVSRSKKLLKLREVISYLSNNEEFTERIPISNTLTLIKPIELYR